MIVVDASVALKWFVEEAGTLRPSDEEARRRRSSPPLLLVLPGSRTVEIRRHSDPFEAAIKLVAARCGPLELVLPTVAHLHDQVKEATARRHEKGAEYYRDSWKG